MARPWSYKLYDLPAFAGLETVGREFNVRFRLFGGAASRLAMALWHDRRLSRTLVDLTPFASDVDLEHSGDEARTSEIQAAIDAYVVDAPWCRWSLVGQQTAATLRARREESTHIPLRSVVFESWRASDVDDQVIEDLQSLRVSIRPHRSFAETQARRSETDLEVFGLLLALNAAADLAFAADAPVNVDVDAAALLLGRYIRSDDAAVLARRPNLRRRLYYLTAALAARSPRMEGPLGRILAILNEAAPIAQLPPQGKAMVVSAALEGDNFRAPRTAGMSLTSDLGADFDAVYTIDPAFDVHGASQAIPLQAGRAPSSGVDLLGRPREFLHLAWRAGGETADVTTAFALDQANALHQGFAVGGALPAGGRWLRMDIGGVLASVSAQAIRIGVLQGDAIDEADPKEAKAPSAMGPGPSAARPERRAAVVLEGMEAEGEISAHRYAADEQWGVFSAYDEEQAEQHLQDQNLIGEV
jgi:hypothetical protein